MKRKSTSDDLFSLWTISHSASIQHELKCKSKAQECGLHEAGLAISNVRGGPLVIWEMGGGSDRVLWPASRKPLNYSLTFTSGRLWMSVHSEEPRMTFPNLHIVNIMQHGIFDCSNLGRGNGKIWVCMIFRFPPPPAVNNDHSLKGLFRIPLLLTLFSVNRSKKKGPQE